MTVGERIREVRTKLGMSQVDFADKINVSKQTLYKYENNLITNIPSDKVEAAAKLGNISPAYLMGWDQIDKQFLGKEASSEIYDKLKKNIEKFHGKENELISIYKELSSGNQNKVLQYSKNLLSNQKMEEELSFNTANNTDQPTTLAAHFDGDKYTDDEMDEVNQFAEFVKNRKK